MGLKDRIMSLESKPDPTQRALLLGIQHPGTADCETEALLSELEQLANNLGIQVVKRTIVSLRTPQARFLIGSGKAAEIMANAESHGCDVIIVDDDLSPAQQRNWEKELKSIAVIDRQEVILDIFAQRARTREAVLQVSLAYMQYTLPRLKRAWGHLNRQRGGGATQRDAGETQLELDQRLVRKRIARLKRELAQVVKHRAVQRKKRLKVPVPTAALVGYTNAGKSSLLNCLTDADALVADKLFATLDPTTRRLKLPSKQTLLLTDTVGFVRRLPHQLINAFKATLEEAVAADFLIHVLDTSSPDVEQHYQTTIEVLRELNPHFVEGGHGVLTVFNKTDLVSDPLDLQVLRSQHPDACFISTYTKEGIPELMNRFESLLQTQVTPMTLRLPHQRYDLRNLLYECGSIQHEEPDANGIYILALVPHRLCTQFKPFEVDA